MGARLDVWIILGLLKCNNISCSEVVIITGNYKSFEYEEYDEISNTPCLDVGNLLTPTFLIQQYSCFS